MSDSRGEMPKSTGAEKNTDLRESFASEKPTRRGARGKSSAARAEQATPGKTVRIDPAHAIGDAPPPGFSGDIPAADVPEAVAPEAHATIHDSQDANPSAAADALANAARPQIGDSPSDVFSVEKLQQLRLQFEQLAGHLRSQQYQLDRREAQLHTQLAQQENEIRATRLWFREQQQESTDREAEFQRRQQQSEAAQLERLAERDAELSRREQELEVLRAGLVENLSQREAELARRESDFDRQSIDWSQQRAEWVDAQARFEAECSDAKRQWQEQADALAANRREVEQDRQALAAEHQARLTADGQQSRADYPKDSVANRATGEAADQNRGAEQPRTDADPFYRQVNYLLEIVRQYLTGAKPTTALSFDNSANAAENQLNVAGIPPERSALFGAFRDAIAKLHARQNNLEEAEALLIDGQAALDQGRRQFTGERQAWHEQCETDRRRLRDERRRAETDLDKKLRAVAERGEHLERRGAAIDQLRAEVLRAQRETLELRLATDEIWAQLAGAVPPPVLTQSLARIRSKLAEQYQLERAELAERQNQLEALAVRLESQREKSHQQKQVFEQWVTDRRNEIEGQASRLVAQELEIARRQNELEELTEQQQGERRIYEAEIRRLLSELRSGRTATPAAA